MASQPNPVDVHVGSRVRLRRTLLGMSQEKLGKAVGLTFQQIQKYERGANRIGSSRLYQLSNVLDVPVSFFFDGVEERLGNDGSGASGGGQDSYESDQLSRRETLELVRAYYRIDDPAVRKKIFDLVKAVSGPKSDDPE